MSSNIRNSIRRYKQMIIIAVAAAAIASYILPLDGLFVQAKSGSGSSQSMPKMPKSNTGSANSGPIHSMPKSNTGSASSGPSSSGSNSKSNTKTVSGSDPRPLPVHTHPPHPPHPPHPCTPPHAYGCLSIGQPTGGF